MTYEDTAMRSAKRKKTEKRKAREAQPYGLHCMHALLSLCPLFGR